MTLDAQSIRDVVQPFVPGWVVMPKQVSFNGHDMLWYNSAGAAINTGFSTDFDVVRQVDAATANNGDYAVIGVILAAGTYTLRHYTTKASGGCKYDVYVDDVMVTSSPIDQYAATTTNAAMTDVTITITTGGYHVIKFLVNGKNASSGDYNLYIGKCAMVPSVY
jgi:hypothetical protein